MNESYENYHFDKVESKRDMQWRWRLIAGNNRIVSVGGEGYTTEAHVDRAIASIERDFRQKTLASDEFFVLRREHWEALKEKTATMEPAEWLKLVEDASL